MLAKETLPQHEVGLSQFCMHPCHTTRRFTDAVACIGIILHYLARPDVAFVVYLPIDCGTIPLLRCADFVQSKEAASLFLAEYLGKIMVQGIDAIMP